MHKDNSASVLIVDDDVSVLEVAGMLLTEAGYNTVLCGNAPDAMEVFKAHSIDTVLSDIKMPGMTGIEVMDHIHAIDPDVPVVLFTAYADLDTAVKAIKK